MRIRLTQEQGATTRELRAFSKDAMFQRNSGDHMPRILPLLASSLALSACGAAALKDAAAPMAVPKVFKYDCITTTPGTRQRVVAKATLNEFTVANFKGFNPGPLIKNAPRVYQGKHVITTQMRLIMDPKLLRLLGSYEIHVTANLVPGNTSPSTGEGRIAVKQFSSIGEFLGTTEYRCMTDAG